MASKIGQQAAGEHIFFFASLMENSKALVTKILFSLLALFTLSVSPAFYHHLPVPPVIPRSYLFELNNAPCNERMGLVIIYWE